MIHRLAHLFGWNGIRVVHVFIDGHWYIGAQCATCGEISHLGHAVACQIYGTPHGPYRSNARPS